MHTLIQAACRALSANDSETLERLALEAQSGSHALGNNLADVQRATAVLTAQAGAAASQIALRTRVLAAKKPETYKAGQWER